ncbi:hypothetical protein G6045_29840 [Streptomyces sp. YC504]|uniref:Uncharacterized protein n=1 Tax=Streptomyces mesophilus TaxID=1775132 RepID=A0A6G4XQG0_9ACTN|nr:DUF6332 family protein [Streptomyces mesophilus]NGO79829.1 hypothetical protein [Streptomyces mesophilus]
MGSRTQAQRDAITVEIGYAFLSGACLAVLAFAAVAGPGWIFDFPLGVRKVLVTIGTVLALLAFLVRVITVLWRFQNATRQPSQPGRTSPDS